MSSASNATRGSNPACLHTSSVMRRQPLASVEAIHGSSARSESESLLRLASGWRSGEDHVVAVLDERRELHLRLDRAGTESWS